MGSIKNMLKTGASQSLNQIKNYDIGKDLKSAQSMVGLDNVQLPKFEMPEAAKQMKLDVDPSIMKLPAGVTNRISPVAMKAASLAGVKLPSEIGGVPLPQMPDLSSMSSKVEESLSGFGFDTGKLGIRSVSDILKEPDLSSLANVKFETPPKVDMPDITSAFDSFSMDGIQSEIDSMTAGIPGVDSINVSKYF